MQTCSTRCSASSYRATGVRYYGCRPAATRCRAFRRRLQEHGCAAGVAQPVVVAAGIDLGRAADGARLVAAVAFIVAALACEVVVTAPAAARVAAHCRQLRRRTQRRGQASGTEDEARRSGAGCHDGTASAVARRSSTRCLPMTESAAPPGDCSVGRSHLPGGTWGDNNRTFHMSRFESCFGSCDDETYLPDVPVDRHGRAVRCRPLRSANGGTQFLSHCLFVD